MTRSPSTLPAPTIVAVADHAVLVSFSDDIDEATLARIHALDAALTRHPPQGLSEIVPAMTTLLVAFDPAVTDHAAITAAVHENLAVEAESAAGVRHVIDVCYDDGNGANLSELAERTGLDVSAVVDAHLAGTYAVGMYGFAPGYAYLYGTPPAIQVPRNPTPGPIVPAGSVIVAGQQCLIIPVAMSTGWFAVGRTAAQMLTTDPARPFLFDVGDTVTFRRIAAAELDRSFAQTPTALP